MTELTRAGRLRGGLLGLLIGDALGVPYEFHSAAQIPPEPQIAMYPPPDFHPAHHVPAGTWSDDGAQALALLDSLLDKGKLDVEDFGQRLLAWLHRGRYAVDGEVFDVGVQTRTALSRLAAGTPAETSGPSGERDNGNGSLMRALPLALLHTGDDADLIRDSFAQSAVTHGHPRSEACVAFYGLWARRLLAGQQPPAAWASAVEAWSSVAPQPHRRELQSHVLDRLDEPPRGTGYVVDSLLASRHLLLTRGSYADVVRGAIALGDDTDTTACIAGGLAGVCYGESDIPQRWRDALRGRTILDPLLERLA